MDVKPDSNVTGTLQNLQDWIAKAPFGAVFTENLRKKMTVKNAVIAWFALGVFSQFLWHGLSFLFRPWLWVEIVLGPIALVFVAVKFIALAIIILALASGAVYYFGPKNASGR